MKQRLVVMDKREEIRRLIISLLAKITDEQTLERIYTFVNQIFCRR